MAFKVGPLTIPWSSPNHRDDPYWDFFVNTVPVDPTNSAVELVWRAPEGSVFPTKEDLHTPEITTSHVKDLALYLGANATGVAKLSGFKTSDGEEYPFAVVNLTRADYDTRQAKGIGGQVPVQNALYITFVLSAWIRELGYRATAKQEDVDADRIAVAAGLGSLNAHGRLVTPSMGSKVHVAHIIFTDLPLAADA